MIYYFHNEYHLGDNVFNLIFFNNIKHYIKKQNIQIYYYCQPNYMEQLMEFITISNVVLFPISDKPSNSLQLWIENSQIEHTFSHIKNISVDNRVCYNVFYKNFFNKVLERLKIHFTFKDFYYKDLDLLKRYDKLQEKYKNIDILILNSQPFSGQYNYNKEEWDRYICKLNQKYTVVTTTKVNNDIKCTTDDNLTIKTIAAISTKVPIIIAVNSGVVPGLLNYYTLKNVKQFYTFDNRCYYSYPNFTSKKKITDITFDELNNFITSKVEPPKVEQLVQVKVEPEKKLEPEIKIKLEPEIKIKLEPEKKLEPKIKLEPISELNKIQTSDKYNDFDWEVYLYFNPDLPIDKNLKSAKSLAWKHFIENGQYENRVYKLDWIKYINENNLSLHIKNKKEVLDYISHNKINKNENSVNDTSNLKHKLFDWEFYVTKHNDLSHIKNYSEAFNHFINYGEKENRQFSEFNWTDYLLLNNDLIENNINTELKATEHWINHGKNEKRKCKM